MFDSILLAVDGTPHSAKAADAAAKCAKIFGAKVVVVHVREHEVGRGAAWYESQEEAASRVRAVVGALEAEGVAARGEVVPAPHGHTARVILEEAAAQGAGLIVIGTQGPSDFTGMLRGSISHRILRHADRPVLVAR